MPHWALAGARAAPLAGPARRVRGQARVRTPRARAVTPCMGVVRRRRDGRGPSRARARRPHAVEWLPKLAAVEVAGTGAARRVCRAASDPRIRYVEPLRPAELAHVRDDPLTYQVDPATGAPVGVAVPRGRRRPGAQHRARRPVHPRRRGRQRHRAGPGPDGQDRRRRFWDPAVREVGRRHDRPRDVRLLDPRRAQRRRLRARRLLRRLPLAVYRAVPLTTVQVAEGIRTLTDAHVRIINLSIVLDSPSQDVIDAIGYASTAGVLVVAAAGNDGGTSIDFPASYVQQPRRRRLGRARGRRDRREGRASLVLEHRPAAVAGRAGHVQHRLHASGSSARSRRSRRTSRGPARAP